MATTTIKIDDTHYEVPEAVANRMREYYKGMTSAMIRNDNLVAIGRKMRDKQKAYFDKRNQLDLRDSKKLESDFDALLKTGGDAKKEAEQQALFR